MIRGASEEFRFKLPYNLSEIEKVKITFWQEYNNGPSPDRPLPILKVLEQCRQGDAPNVISVTLNSEETLRFSEKIKAKVQLRARTFTGIPVNSAEELITVYPVQDDSILDGEILPTPTLDGWIYLDGKNITEEV